MKHPHTASSLYRARALSLPHILALSLARARFILFSLELCRSLSHSLCVHTRIKVTIADDLTLDLKVTLDLCVCTCIFKCVWVCTCQCVYTHAYKGNDSKTTTRWTGECSAHGMARHRLMCGVATISRLLKFIGLYCKRAL